VTALAFVPFVQDVLGVTLEDGQRVFWRVAADGVDPVDLDPAEREIARELFGPIERVPPEARRHVAVIKGADIGFSFFGGLRLLHRALTATELGAPGEVRPALVVAPDLRLGRIPVRNALGAAERVPAIAALIESRSADGFVLRREGGRRTSVECLPASVGGRALRGRRYVEVFFDESAFFRDATYAVNDQDCERAVLPRCLGTFWTGSTPWLESAAVWRTYVANFGAPSSALAVRMRTLAVRTDRRVVELVQTRRELDPEGAATEFDCEPPAAGGGEFFDPAAIVAAQDPERALALTPPALPPARVACGDLAFKSDSSALVVVYQWEDGGLELAELLEMCPTRTEPLKPSLVASRFSTMAHRHSCPHIVVDGFSIAPMRERFGEWGIALGELPGGATGKVAMFEALRAVLHEGRLRLPSLPRLASQLREVVAKPTAGGTISISSPRRRFGGHGDLVSALAGAVYLLERQRTAPRRRTFRLSPGIVL